LAHTPTVVGNSIYVGSCNGMFRQLDVRTGKVQWETSVKGSATKYFFHGDVLSAGDRIIASADIDNTASGQAGVHAFERGTGRELWKHQAGRGVKGAVVGTGNRAFAYTASGDLVALNLQSGQLEWSHPLKADAWESPAASASRVFAGSAGGSVIAFDAATGRRIWERKLSGEISTSIRTSGSAVYAGTADGVLHRLGASSGEVLSSLKLDGRLKPASAPAVRSDSVLVLLTDPGADYRALVSVDPSLTRVIWRQDARDRWTTSRVFVTDRTAFVGTPAGEVSAVCVETGLPLWSEKIAADPVRSIGGSDDLLFVGTPAGSLYAVRPSQTCRQGSNGAQAALGARVRNESTY
jgi:outer membrane protein assembly factor BamB